MIGEILYLDYEAQSECELKTAGTYQYARHPSTRILFMASAFDDEPVQLWAPDLDEGPPQRVLDHMAAGGEVWAHYAVMERLVTNYVARRDHGFPLLSIEQMVCTLVQCANMALPLSLENAAVALCLPERKDMDKRKSMLKISKPLSYDPISGEPVFATRETHPEDFQRCGEYCVGDVEVERAIVKQVRRLSPFEKRVYEADQRINDRGFRVDLPTVYVMKRLAQAEQDRLNGELEPLCGLKHTQTVKLKAWIEERGVEVPALDKHEVGALLKRPDLPDVVRKAVTIRQEAAKSSVAKLVPMIERAEADDRVRGCFQIGGAVSTFRWAHRAVQTGNLPRPELPADLIETILDWLSQQKPEDDGETLETIRVLWGRPMSVFSDCLRGLLVPEPGKVFVGPDLVSIESLCSAWLVGDDPKVEFMAAGGKVYEEVARMVLGLAPFRGWRLDAEGVPVTKQQRQKGKVAELAMGYEGGYKEDGAIGTFCVQQGVPYPGEEEAKRWQSTWREHHPRHVAYWKAISQAAVDAVLNPGSRPSVGPSADRKVTFRLRGRFLECRLPSESVLVYPFPRVEQQKKHFPPGVTYMKAKDKLWFRNSYYGGHGLENVTQRVARDLLAQGILNLEDAGFPVVTHSHDEAVVEVYEQLGIEQTIMEIFVKKPAWAATLPYSASAFTAKRYRK